MAKKKEEKTVVFYWWEPDHGKYWAIKDENGMMQGYSIEFNTFEEALHKAYGYTFGYYQNVWYGHPVRFVIDPSVFNKDKTVIVVETR